MGNPENRGGRGGGGGGGVAAHILPKSADLSLLDFLYTVLVVLGVGCIKV